MPEGNLPAIFCFVLFVSPAIPPPPKKGNNTQTTQNQKPKHWCWKTGLWPQSFSSSLPPPLSAGKAQVQLKMNCAYKTFESSLGNGPRYSLPNVWNCNCLWVHPWEELRGDGVGLKRLQHALCKHTSKQTLSRTAWPGHHRRAPVSQDFDRLRALFRSGGAMFRARRAPNPGRLGALGSSAPGSLRLADGPT